MSEHNGQGDALQVGDVNLLGETDALRAIILAEQRKQMRLWLNELDDIQREMETMRSRVKTLTSEIRSQVR